MANNYDVAIIGSGPAGYVSAIRCAQLGLKTVCVEKVTQEKEVALGGTCLNVGCIPSKALLESSLVLLNANENLKVHGIKASKISFDLNQMHERKNGIVSTMSKGVAGLFKLNKIDVIQGQAYVADEHTLQIISESDDSNITAENIILASGSKPIELPGFPFDEKLLLSSNGALRIEEVPNRVAVIGAGAVGLELGSVWSRLGSEVTICEALTEFLPNADDAISKEALKVFSKQGLNIHLGTEVESLEQVENKVRMTLSNKELGDLEVDKVIFAVGRKPASEGLFDPKLGIELEDQGFVRVNEFCQTDVQNIYAIGDLVRGPMLSLIHI